MTEPHNPGRTEPTALSIQALTAGYRSQAILFDVTANFQAARITAIIGPNGAGKSTLFKSIFGLARVFGGRVEVNGEQVAPDARALVQSRVAYVPQLRNVFPSLTVRENLEMGVFRGRFSGFDRVFTLFPDLASVQKKAAGKLSGGQRTMLAVGRALLSEPTVILLDEATGGLSPLLVRTLWGHFAHLVAQGVAVVAIEQDVRTALEFADYVYVLAGGKNLMSGTPSDLSSRANFGQLFLEGGGADDVALRAELVNGETEPKD